MDDTPVLVHNAGGLCPTNGLSYGPIGEAATHEVFQKAGYTNITREVQFINSNGDAFRADFVAQNPSGNWEALEAKTGAGYSSLGRSCRRWAMNARWPRMAFSG